MERAVREEPPFRWFRDDLCDRCGLCLHACPVLRLPVDAARRDVEALIRGDVERSRAFRQCTTCNLCDAVCPRGADPYELLLERFHAEVRRRGLPRMAALVIPTERGNLWGGVQTLMPPRERRLVRRWRAALRRPREEILLTGFYTNLVPFLLRADVLAPLRAHAAGSEGLWGCGGDTHKMGLLDHTAQIGALLQRVFGDLGVRRVRCVMSAEAAMLTEVLPRRYGVRLDVEVSTLDDWLLERLRRGDVPVLRPQRGRVAVHDNCMARHMGGRLHDTVRSIVRRCGGTLVEMAHGRDRSLCCGWAATIPTLVGPASGSPRRTLTYLLASLKRRLDEARAAGAETIVASCPACYLFLNLAVVLAGVDVEVLHPVELVERAAGGSPEHLGPRRAVDVLAVALHLLSSPLSGPASDRGAATGARSTASGPGWGRFHPPPIAPAAPIVPRPATPREAASIRRWATLLRAVLLRRGPARRLATGGLSRSTDAISLLMDLRARASRATGTR